MTFVFDGIITKITIRNTLGKNYMTQDLLEHFSTKGHNSFLVDVSVIFIDKTDPKDPNKREHYWRHTLKTIATHGLM